ncbi:MAG: ATP-binding protein [Acidimicrobiia bacterium]
MTRTVARFVRLLLLVGVAAIIGLAAAGAGVWAVLAVAAVVGVAVFQHTRLLALVRDETVRTIETEDPADPEAFGAVADAIRRRVETERAAADRLAEDLRRSIEAAGIGVLVLERDGRVLASVGATVELVPTAPSQRLKNPAVLDMVAEVLDTGEPVADSFVMGVRNRTYQWLVSPFDEATVGAVITDVTERHRIMEMRRSFVTDASHELKTPIAAIAAAAEALQLAVGVDDARAKRFAEQLGEQASRLGRIVTDLLDLSRLETDVGEMEPMDLRAVVEAEAVASEVFAEAAGLDLEADLHPVWIEGSRADVGLAVRNVLSNAVRYTSAGGRVSVWCGERDGRGMVVVADTGIGIPKSEHDRIFHRFHRVDTGRSRATGGTGLGLAIVRHVVDRHGGWVLVDSVVGRGSTFTLDFGPVVPPPT